MNILLSVPWDNLGGVSTVVNRVALFLRARGHAPCLLLPGESDEVSEVSSRIGLRAFRLNQRPVMVEGARLRSAAGFAAHFAGVQGRLRTLCRDLAIDAVNIHYPDASSVSLVLASRIAQIPLVTSIHGADLLPYIKASSLTHHSVNFAIHRSRALVSPSHAFVTAARERWPLLRTRDVDVIPNGIDPVELAYEPGGAWSEATPPYILSIAALVAYKGVDILIRAFAQIAQQYPTLRLRLASGGPLRSDLEALAQQLGVAHRVDFLGIVDRAGIAALLKGCTVFVLASRSSSESFGIAAAEAMALDRLVIVSRVGALPEMVDDQRTGLLVPPGDTDALAAAMRQALDDRPLRERLGKAAGAMVREKLLWECTGAEYERVLQRVTMRARPRPETPDHMKS